MKTVVKVDDWTHSVYWPDGMSPAVALTEAVQAAEAAHEGFAHEGAWCYPAIGIKVGSVEIVE
jgi:hypothetical protein